jgi:large subunit ribosomal protein L35
MLEVDHAGHKCDQNGRDERDFHVVWQSVQEMHGADIVYRHSARDRYAERPPMPKMKSHSGAKKRFKKTGSGQLKARHAMSSHILEKKSPKYKRGLAMDVTISKADRKTVTRLLGGGGGG